MTASDLSTDRLAACLNAWGWPQAFKDFEGGVLFLTDADILAGLGADWGKGQGVALASVDALETLTPAPNQTIVVFSRDRELRKARDLKNRLPGHAVLSGTYDILPTHYVRKLHVKGSGPKGGPAAAPLVIFSLPGAEAEFLAKTMNSCALGYPQEYFDPAMACWAAMHDRFSLLRFLRSVESHLPRGRRLSLIIQGDTLQTLFRDGRLSFSTVIRYLEQTSADVVYLERRDKFLHVELAGIRGKLGVRSFFGAAVDLPKALDFKPLPTEEYFSALLRVMEQEADLEDMVGKFPRLKILTTEDVTCSPREVMKDLGIFLGLTPNLRKEKLPRYSDLLALLPALPATLEGRRKDFLSTFSFGKNSVGSLETASMSLVRDG